MKRLLTVMASLRTTALLIILLVLLLLLNVAMPQERTLGTAAIDQIASRSPFAFFFLRSMGMANIPTSPVFLAVLALFFLNLIAVLVERTPPTLSRIRVIAPSPETLDRWTASPKALATPRPPGWGAERAIRLLRGFGYRPKSVAPERWWGVRHRTAPLGFLLFHISFFFLSAGGALIYYTRFVASIRLVEGELFEGYFRKVIRESPLGRPPVSAFELVSVKPSFARGEPTDLWATVRPIGIAGIGDSEVRVNHPVTWGNRSILVMSAGVAPELWLQDSNGFTLDRVSVATPTRREEVTAVSLADGALTARIRPVVAPDRFPSREDLPRVPLEIEVRDRDGTQLFRGTLHQGEAARAGNFRLVIPGMRYWAGFLIVDERGGSLLILGFVLGVIGAVWRLMTHRREIAMVWDEGTVRIAGKSEFFQRRFQDELESILATIASSSAASDAEDGTSVEV